MFRWGIYIHGSTDGYSQLITYLKATQDKRAATVHDIFMQAIEELGASPKRVCCDKGRENVGVIFMMYVLNNGAVLKPVLTGRSVHNTRIERLWCEVHRVVGQHFKDIFYALEDFGLLDVDNPIDI